MNQKVKNTNIRQRTTNYKYNSVIKFPKLFLSDQVDV